MERLGNRKTAGFKKAAVGLFYLCAFLLPFATAACRQTVQTSSTIQEENSVREVKKIALTFDDGPHPKWTPVLLDGLKQRGVKASFFLIGMNAVEYPELVERMDREGHLIGNHTYHHVRLDQEEPRELKKEIEDTDKVIFLTTGRHTGYVRPPYGIWKENLERELGVLPVMWTIDPLDWEIQDTEEITERVVTQAQEDAIILLHDCYGSSVEAALQIVDRLQQEGFTFVTVEELLLG